MSTPPSLVFDLDGTISDPALGIGRSINFALESCGYSPIQESDVSQLIGPPLEQVFAVIVDSPASERIKPLIEKYRERYADVGYSENVIYPGIVEALQQLRAANVPLGICTSKQANFAESILHHFGIRQYFDFISGGGAGIIKHAQLASLLSESVIANSSTMIGDRAIDIHAAKSNSLRSVGVLWGHGSHAELLAASPDVLLKSPQELASLVGAA